MHHRQNENTALHSQLSVDNLASTIYLTNKEYLVIGALIAEGVLSFRVVKIEEILSRNCSRRSRPHTGKNL